MYALVVLLGVLSVYLSLKAVTQNRNVLFGVFVLINWLMISLHYYSLLLVGAEALYYTAWILRPHQSFRLQWKALSLAFLLSVAPLALWMVLAPGFAETLEVVMRQAGHSQRTAHG